MSAPTSSFDPGRRQFLRRVTGAGAVIGDRPVFGVTCGDITFDSPELYPKHEAAVQEMGVPFLHVLGNHDMDYGAPTDDGSAQTYREQFGPTCSSFDRGAVHYVVLDDDQPKRFSWIDPARTRHLFYAPVSPDHGRLRAEAIDRFGRTHSAR